MNRHDLLWPGEQARQEAARKAAADRPGDARWISALICSGIPAIVKRQEHPRPGTVEVGFSAPERQEGVRRRVAVRVPLTGICRQMTPFEAAAVAAVGGFRLAGLVAELMALGARHGLKVGIFGSAALEAVTGLAYMDSGSDLDAYLYPRGGLDRPGLLAFRQAAGALAAQAGIGLDTEIQLPDGMACKLTELLGDSKTVLCKGLSSVELKPVAGLWRASPLEKTGEL